MATKKPKIHEEVFFSAADRGADRVAALIKKEVYKALMGLRERAANGTLSLAIEHRDAAFASSQARNFPIAAELFDAISSTSTKAEDDSILDEAILIGLLLGSRILATEFSSEDIERIVDRARRYVSSEVASQLESVDQQNAFGIALAVLLVSGFIRQGGAAGSAAVSVFREDSMMALLGLNRIQVQTIVTQAQSEILAGIVPSRVRERIIRDASRMLSERAELIASTIAERSINLAQQATVEIAVERGVIAIDTHVRQWVSRADGKVCPRCRDFHLVTAKIDQPFTSRRGEVAWVPDIHPQGRCRFRIVAISSLGAAA